jgi:hypothetical protein
MQISSYTGSKIKQGFNKFFDKGYIDHIGQSCGLFSVSKKNYSLCFVIGFIESCCKGCYTYS